MCPGAQALQGKHFSFKAFTSTNKNNFTRKNQNNNGLWTKGRECLKAECGFPHSKPRQLPNKSTKPSWQASCEIEYLGGLHSNISSCQQLASFLQAEFRLSHHWSWNVSRSTSPAGKTFQFQGIHIHKQKQLHKEKSKQQWFVDKRAGVP